MKKADIIHLHTLLVLLKKYCEECDPGCNFKKYNELDISPFQVYRSKEEHMLAIFVLVTDFELVINSWRYSERISEIQKRPCEVLC